MKVYLDTCCLNRPWDDQSQPRIHFETEAILLILAKLDRHEWEWIGSEILFYEIRLTTDDERREYTLLLASQSHSVIELTPKILEHAESLENAGFDAYDAIHLASADAAQADIFLTTDDQMVKRANRNKKLFSLRVENPVKWLEEVLK